MRKEVRRNFLWLAIILVVIALGIVFPRLMIISEIAGREFFILRWLLLPAAVLFWLFYVTRPRKD
jgi:hypothetical protein